MALAGAAAGLAAGVVAERVAVNRKRARDPEAGEDLGRRRGVRARRIQLDDGARLFVEEIGPESRSGAVLVHGSMLRTDAWHYQMAGLGDHRLVLYDLRGHGMSQPKGDSPYTVARLALDLKRVIEDSGLEEVVIVGHSVGGMVAQQLCLDEPAFMDERIKGLVLLNTTYGPAVETLIGGAALARFERVTRRPFDLLGGQSGRIDSLRRLIRPTDAVFWGVAFSAFGPAASAHQVDFVYDMVAETQSDVIFDLIRSYRDFDARGRLDRITVPALVIAGEHDRLTLSGASEYLAQHLPKNEFHVLADVGHMSMMESHEEINELLERFLDDTLGKSERKIK